MSKLQKGTEQARKAREDFQEALNRNIDLRQEVNIAKADLENAKKEVTELASQRDSL